jgi:hypothetical protein
MGPSLRKLLEIGSAPLAPNYIRFGKDFLDDFGKIGDEIREVLSCKNGFFCFESALHFFPSVTVEESWGMEDWNRRESWKYEYEGLADEFFCFAEEIFGMQFCVHDEEIGIFNPETCEFKGKVKSLEEFASMLLLDYNWLTGHSFAHDWQKSHGRLPLRYRLMPKRFFVVGGEYALSNFAAVDSLELMRYYGNFATQIHDLPEGSEIKLIFSPRPEKKKK